ncbi:MAG: hypothetical protein JL50_12280 [Peptococcaceae bacterium BICA1-7]|nr:MAG: hypothetical protein JL50_12280 [Peptococcaceae bacterium BICA1-7]HBV97009.1 hypothetical protein [Desulfotomaculum sp.]
MIDYLQATLLPLEEKINFLDNNDRRLLDEITNHILMTHELLQNHRSCIQSPGKGHIFSDWRIDPHGDYLGNHH